MEDLEEICEGEKIKTECIICHSVMYVDRDLDERVKKEKLLDQNDLIGSGCSGYIISEDKRYLCSVKCYHEYTDDLNY